MTNKILFFGCGTHREAAMMSYLLGRAESEFKGVPATIRGYSLCIQRLDQTPDTIFVNEHGSFSVQSLLRRNWDDSFRNYIIKADPEGSVAGIIWELDYLDFEIIKYWEIVDYGWYEECDVVAHTDDGQQISVRSVRLRKGHQIDSIVDSISYDPWLQSQEQYKIAATKSRQDFLSLNAEKLMTDSKS